MRRARARRGRKHKERDEKGPASDAMGRLSRERTETVDGALDEAAVDGLAFAVHLDQL